MGFEDWSRGRSRRYLISYDDKEWIYILSGFLQQREHSGGGAEIKRGRGREWRGWRWCFSGVRFHPQEVLALLETVLVIKRLKRGDAMSRPTDWSLPLTSE